MTSKEIEEILARKYPPTVDGYIAQHRDLSSITSDEPVECDPYGGTMPARLYAAILRSAEQERAARVAWTHASREQLRAAGVL